MLRSRIRLELQARALALAAVTAKPYVKEPGRTRLRVAKSRFADPRGAPDRFAPVDFDAVRFVAKGLRKVVLEGHPEVALPIPLRGVESGAHVHSDLNAGRNLQGLGYQLVTLGPAVNRPNATCLGNSCKAFDFNDMDHPKDRIATFQRDNGD